MRPSSCCCARRSTCASVAEVAQEARLAKGTVYLYFRSKEELLLAVHERGIDRFFRAVDALLAGTGAGHHRRHAGADAAAHRRAAAVPADGVALLRRDGAQHVPRSSASRSSCAWPTGWSARAPGWSATSAQLGAGRGPRAAAPQLRADPRPVADVARARRRRRARGVGARRRRVAGLRLELPDRSSIARCARCGTAASARRRRDERKIACASFDRSVGARAGVRARAPSRSPRARRRRRRRKRCARCKLAQVVVGGAADRSVFAGEVKPRYENDLAFRIGGKIVARNVDVGTRVRKGQMIARLDPADVALQAEAAKAQVGVGADRLRVREGRVRALRESLPPEVRQRQRARPEAQRPQFDAREVRAGAGAALGVAQPGRRTRRSSPTRTA